MELENFEKFTENKKVFEKRKVRIEDASQSPIQDVIQVMGGILVLVFVIFTTLIVTNAFGIKVTNFKTLFIVGGFAFLFIIIAVVVYTILQLTIYAQTESIQLNSDEVYKYYNKNKKSIFNPELFEALKFPDVRLDTNTEAIYFDNKDITKSLMKYNTVEKQIEYIQSLRVKI